MKTKLFLGVMVLVVGSLGASELPIPEDELLRPAESRTRENEAEITSSSEFTPVTMSPEATDDEDAAHPGGR